MKPNNFSSMLKKLFSKKGAVFVLIGIVSGVLLLVLPSNESKENANTDISALPDEEYCRHLEQKAEELIKTLPNVKECKVFITLEGGYRYVYATDQHVRESETGKETDKTVVLASDGNGESPLLIESRSPVVSGIAVVCPNASYDTQYRIIELMCALFNVQSNRISVQT